MFFLYLDSYVTALLFGLVGLSDCCIFWSRIYQIYLDFYHNSFKITRKLAPGRYLEALGSLWGTKGGAMNGIWEQLLVRTRGFGRSLGSLFVIFFVEKK